MNKDLTNTGIFVTLRLHKKNILIREHLKLQLCLISRSKIKNY